MIHSRAVPVALTGLFLPVFSPGQLVQMGSYNLSPLNCTTQALKVSLVIGDSTSIRTALHDIQRQKYGKTKAISSHCPTRWGIAVFITMDLLDSEDALRALVESDDRKQVSKGSTNASKALNFLFLIVY